MYISSKRLNHIINLAQSCLNKFGTRNPFIISEILGIHCSTINVKYIDAFSEKNNNGINTIYISSSFGYYYQKILCAHELGHILLHQREALHLFEGDKCQINNIKEKEYEANVFAMNLMPQIQPRDKNYLEYTPDELQYYIKMKIHSDK